VAAGESHAIALLADGTVVGWGRDTDGQARPPQGLATALGIAVGGSHSIALAALPPCPADIFVDGQVNGADLGVVLSQWGLGAGAASDINRDGVVNGADLAAVLGHWGPCGG
jgi:hypothetical protein